MSDTERIDRLERLLRDLALALSRKDTERNGNWGFPPFGEELERIGLELDPQPEPPLASPPRSKPPRKAHGGFDCNNTQGPDGRDGSPF